MRVQRKDNGFYYNAIPLKIPGGKVHVGLDTGFPWDDIEIACGSAQHSFGLHRVVEPISCKRCLKMFEFLAEKGEKYANDYIRCDKWELQQLPNKVIVERQKVCEKGN